MSEQSLLSLIAASAVCKDALSKQMDFTDEHLTAKTVTDEIWALQHQKGDELDQVIIQICAYRPADVAEMDLKARFLLDWTGSTEMTADEAKALLLSMLSSEEEASA